MKFPLFLVSSLLLFFLTVGAHAVDRNKHIMSKLDLHNPDNLLSIIRNEPINANGWTRDCYNTYINLRSTQEYRVSLYRNQSLMQRLDNKISAGKAKLASPECALNDTMSSYTSDVASVILKAFIKEESKTKTYNAYGLQKLIYNPRIVFPGKYVSVVNKGMGVFINEYDDVSVKCAKELYHFLPTFIFVSHIEHIAKTFKDNENLQYPVNAPIKLRTADEYKDILRKINFYNCNDNDLKILNEFVAKVDKYLEFLPEVVHASVAQRILEIKHAKLYKKKVAERKKKAARLKRENELALKKEKFAILAKKRTEYINNLRSGKVPIKTLEDAKLFHGIKNVDMSVVISPPLMGSNVKYLVSGVIDSVKAGVVTAKVRARGNIYYFSFILSASQFKSLAHKLRYNGFVRVLGKHIDTIKYQTVSGSMRYMPRLEALFVAVY